MTPRRVPLALAAALLVGCAGPVWMPHTPVPVSGATESLAGVWRGTYESRDTGRFGDILFALSARADSAVGEVVMVPRGHTVTVEREADRWQWSGATRPQILTIRFVGVRGDSVRGALDPYPDPDCGCELHTTFEGVVTGDGIAGRFTSRAPEGHDAEGSWEVTRRDPAP